MASNLILGEIIGLLNPKCFNIRVLKKVLTIAMGGQKKHLPHKMLAQKIKDFFWTKKNCWSTAGHPNLQGGLGTQFFNHVWPRKYA